MDEVLPQEKSSRFEGKSGDITAINVDKKLTSAIGSYCQCGLQRGKPCNWLQAF